MRASDTSTVFIFIFIAVLDAKYAKDAVRTAKWVQFLSRGAPGVGAANAKPKKKLEL